ncbi:unnamed protein product [Cunninghamella echinulata]
MVYKSTFPQVPIPDLDIFSFLSQKNKYTNKSDINDVVVSADGHSDRTLTYGQVFDISTQLGAGWKNQVGLGKNDTVAIFAPNQYDHIVLYFSLLLTNCVITPGNPSYTEITDSGANALVTIPELLPILLKVCQQAGIPRERIFLFGNEEVDGCKPFYSLIRPGQRVSGPSKDFDAKKDTAFICYSSGTTGKPKGTLLTHNNFVTQTLVYDNFDPDITKEGDVYIAFLPLYHIYGLTMMFGCFYRAFKLVVMSKFDLVLFCELIQKHRVTIANIVPPIAVLLAKHPIVKNYDLSSVRMFGSGAAPLGKEHIDALVERIPSSVRQGWGMTETTSGFIIQHSTANDPGSIGILLPNCEAKIVDENNNELGDDKAGELLVRGGLIVKGYLNNPESNANTFTSDGWLRTGDVAVFNSKNKQFYIVDRIKELIKYKGLQVAPAELEALLLGNKKIADCCVVGVYDSKEATEYPRAYVVLQPGISANEATEKEIIDFVASKAANHKRLRGGVRFIDQIPKSPAGKILRKEVREWIKKEQEQESSRARL